MGTQAETPLDDAMQHDESADSKHPTSAASTASLTDGGGPPSRMGGGILLPSPAGWLTLLTLPMLIWLAATATGIMHFRYKVLALCRSWVRCRSL